MRTGVQLPIISFDLEAIDEELRLVGKHLVDAMKSIPVPGSVPHIDHGLAQDLRYSVAEAIRINREYRRRIADRLAGATPEQSHHASLHDPPDACQSRSSPP